MDKVPSHLIPQARSLVEIVRALRAISEGIESKKALSDKSGLRERQFDYALNAAQTLGWLTDLKIVTPLGAAVISASDDVHPQLIRKSIGQSRVLNVIAPTLLGGRGPSMRELISSIQAATEPQLGAGTAEHRAKCLLAWRRYLLDSKVISADGEQLILLQPDSAAAMSKPSRGHTTTPRTDTEEYGLHFIDLRETLRKSPRNTVFITGAGIGKLSGLPLWSELRNQVCQVLAGIIAGMPDGPAKEGRQATLAEIKAMTDLWGAFSRIKREMPPAMFNRVIHKSLTPASDIETNGFYERIWSLGVRGVVTFNIDETAEKAYAGLFGDTVASCDATIPQQYSGLLHADSEPFVFHPHGLLSAPQGWVFSAEERDDALNNGAYRKFLSGLFLAKTVVIAGFNPNDISFESHIIETARQMMGGHRIYIVCPREYLDPSTYERYQAWDFRIVTYNLRTDGTNKHAGLLDLLDKIQNHIPDSDVPASAFIGQPIPLDELPSDDVLAQLDEEIIRDRLNAAVAFIASQAGPSEKEQIRCISELFTTYPRSTYKAWFFVSGDPKLGRLFGRTVDSEIGGGAFGRVYLAHKDDGELLAVKILLENVRKDPAYLLSFRRGIKSMKILNDHNVEGMVQIRESYEVPPTIFMEYVSGLTLDAALDGGYIKSLRSKMVILEKIARIVATAHELDEVVLHRDLKPANVILRDPIFGSDDFDVVVLDFDLSWHKGSNELSVAHNARMQGYAAPEQVQRGDATPSALTRNTGVDSFGFGMLIFYLFAERHPIPNEQRLPSFRRILYDAASQRNSSSWRLVPRQISNLAIACVQERQNLRPSVRESQVMISSLITAIDDDVLEPDDMNVRYEIMDRVLMNEDYSDNSSDYGGVLGVDMPPIFMSVALSPTSDGRGELSILLRRTQMDHDHRTFFAKYIESRVRRVTTELKHVGFDVEEPNPAPNMVEISARCVRGQWSSQDVGRIADAIQRCRSHLTG